MDPVQILLLILWLGLNVFLWGIGLAGISIFMCLICLSVDWIVQIWQRFDE